ncbi:glycosyltransferase [Pseudonocardia hispaniensis]|uniref:Glycosyltransferase n=1 Tax=Pseudonocardia hispaniensis TaxID=904933 RepID=A0ABW1J275_9PSEU
MDQQARFRTTGNGRSAHPNQHTAVRVSVVIPTRHEGDNIAMLLDRLLVAARDPAIEVIFVDDSDDDTPARITAYATSSPARIHLVHRSPGERTGGLGGAVLTGMRRAGGEWVVVMDGDLQHPPELACRLAEIGRSRNLDLVVASRYVGTGDASGLGSGARHAVSGAATTVAKVVFPARLAQPTDPMSGLFAVRLGAIDLDDLHPTGFKILMEILVRRPGLRLAEVPFAMSPRNAGESKASLREGLHFLHHLARLRLGLFTAQVDRSVRTSPWHWLLRMFLFGLVGLSGLVVNTVALWLLHQQVLGLHYLLAAGLATQLSTAWLFLLAESIVFRGSKPGRRRSRGIRFFLVNNLALLLRLPLLALLVEAFGVGVLIANLVTLVLMFLVRFVVVDAAIYGTGPVAGGPTRPREPMRVIVEVPPTGAGQPAPTRSFAPSRSGHPAARYLPYRYAIPGVATIGSQVRLPELEYFRVQSLGNDTEIQVRLGAVGDRTLHRRAAMTQLAAPPAVCYQEHLGRLAANFSVRLGTPIEVVVAPPLARSPHVVYTNVLEALLRFVAVSKGAMLLHAACIQLDGTGLLISARTDTGKTGTVLRLLREHGAKFLADDMTVLHPDGRVGCFPKPLTISHHTLRAVAPDELTAREWRRLRVQSLLHSREGRSLAIQLSRRNVPIMGINALTQRLVPPPKYAVDRLLPCEIVAGTPVSELFVIERGPRDEGELAAPEAVTTLLANTEDAYRFPPFAQFAPAIVLGADDHEELRRKERQILAAAVACWRCRWLSTPDFTWADRIPELLVPPVRNRRPLTGSRPG